MLTNYYFVLGIPYTATEDEIKRAFRAKAKIFHPDINKNVNAKVNFQMLNEAYHILIDTEKRRAYDYKWQTRYGNSFHNRFNSTQHAEKTNYYKAYTGSPFIKKDPKIERTSIDIFLFCFLILVGIASVFMGVTQLIYKEWKGVDSLSGLFFGLWILFLLLYGWRYIAKEK